MDLKRKIGAVLIAAAAILSLHGCAVMKVKEIEVTSVSLMYVVPTSARSADAKLLIGIHNPSVPVKFSNIEGSVKLKGEAVATLAGEEFEIEPRCDKEYEVPVTVTLAEDISIIKLIKILASDGEGGLTADISLRGALSRSGIGRNLEFKDIQLLGSGKK